MKITLAHLKSSGACSDQVELFQKLFGAEAEITVVGCLAVADKFDWDWAAEKFLTAPALAEYERVTAPAWAEYQRVRATAWATGMLSDHNAAH